MMKVLSLLQDADETLAFAIVSSREAIWGLTAVIALHGLPCGQVVAATQLAESDYAATC